MPGGIPIGFNLCNPQILTSNNTLNLHQAFFQTASSINTKTAWNQVNAATASDISVLDFSFADFANSTATDFEAIDIGIGAAGLEVTLVLNFVVGGGDIGLNDVNPMTQLPIQIPAGSRVAMRYQSTTLTGSQFPLGFALNGYDGDFTQVEGAAGCDTIGVSVTTSPYTSAFTPGVNKQPGSWTQVIASTSNDYFALLVHFDTQRGHDTAFPNIWIDIGVGGAGSEQVIINDLRCAGGIPYGFPVFYVQIPSGTRLSVRGRLDTTTTTGSYGICMYGLYH